MSVKVIETHYAGHRFRSRLEARWAVFFDALGIRWEYEPQGFLIGMYEEEHPYLPDYYLPDLDLWVEVKGSDARMNWPLIGVAVDSFSASGLPDSRHSYPGGSAVIVLGNIPDGHTNHPLVINQKGAQCYGAYWTETGEFEYHGYSLGHFDTTWAGFAGQWQWCSNNPDPESVHGESSACCGPLFGAPCTRDADNVARAYTKARKARFEHGETP